MFESRLRQHRDGNRFAATSSIYHTRVNASVLESNKINGVTIARKRHDNELQELREKRRKMDHDITTKAWHATVDFVGEMLAEKEALYQLAKVDEKLAFLETHDPEAAWRERMDPLKPDQPMSLAVLSPALGNDEEIFTVNPDYCNCGRIFRFKYVTHMQVCLICKQPVPTLLSAEDVQSDFGTQQKDKAGAHNRGKNNKMRQAALAAGTAAKAAGIASSAIGTMVVASVSASGAAGSGHNHPTRKLEDALATGKVIVNDVAFRKWLMQFAEDACEIPQKVWRVLYESLASCHLLSSTRCKPGPVERILKDNRLSAYCAHAVRISKMFNGEPLPVLTLDLIDRLLERYKHLYRASLLVCGNTKSLPGKEILTHVFLLMENSKLACAFATHKSSNVSPIHSPKFWSLVQECSKSAPEFSWKYS